MVGKAVGTAPNLVALVLGCNSELSRYSLGAGIDSLEWEVHNLEVEVHGPEVEAHSLEVEVHGL